MAVFPRTLAVLVDLCRRRASNVIVPSSLILGWLVWFAVASVPVYVTSEVARVESEVGFLQISARMESALSSLEVAPGDRLGPGELVAVLESPSQDLILAQARATLTSVRAELRQRDRARALAVARLSVSAAEQAALLRQLAAARDTSAEALRRAEAELDREQGLHEEGIVSAAVVDALRSEVVTRKSALAAAREVLTGGTRSGERIALDEASALEQIESEMVVLEAALQAAEEAVSLAERTVRDLRVRSPRSGVVASVTETEVGGLVSKGERLASLLPEGPLVVRARLAPPGAVGRVRAGQPAVVRLEHAVNGRRRMPAEVASVGSEEVEGLVQVVLRLLDDGDAPLEAGLPCLVDIEVDRVTPLQVAIRQVEKARAALG